MKKLCLVFWGVLGMAVVTATEISDTVVRQRWPFDEKVDVDYTLTGTASDVAFSATWAGRDKPFELGVALCAKPGRNRFTWDPSASAVAGQTLADFRVTATPVSSDERTYLVVDLVNGGYTFANAAPAGGWSSADKQDRMVFRRIPAGTYTNGIDSAALTKMNGGNTPTVADAWQEREVTFTSDCYVGVFQMTGGQYNQIMAETRYSREDLIKPAQVSYDALRGSTTDGIDWPATKYAVATNSIVAKLRAKAGGDLVVDLCEDEQWEVAARAGTRTYWTNGGVYTESVDTWKGYVDEIAIWKRNTTVAVGYMAPNPWGLYDTVGNLREWTLDKTDGISGGTVDTTPRTDPVGPNVGAKRVYRGWIMQPDPPLCYMVPANRNDATPATSAVSVRFCIHLNPLKFAE